MHLPWLIYSLAFLFFFCIISLELASRNYIQFNTPLCSHLSLFADSLPTCTRTLILLWVDGLTEASTQHFKKKYHLSVLSKTCFHKTISRKKIITWYNWVANQRDSHFSIPSPFTTTGALFLHFRLRPLCLWRTQCLQPLTDLCSLVLDHDAIHV